MPVVVEYIETMRRSLVSRIAAIAIATLVGISTPGSALAHGFAHHEASEHAERDREHRHEAGLDSTNGSHHALTPSVQATNDSKDHVHAQLAHAVPVRMDAPLFILPSIPASLPSEIVFVGTASLLLTAAPARAGPPGAPPRQPRAPPLG